MTGFGFEPFQNVISFRIRPLVNLCLLPYSELSIESDFKIEKEEQQEWFVQSYEI